jgi:hypothetical protein
MFDVILAEFRASAGSIQTVFTFYWEISAEKRFAQSFAMEEFDYGDRRS